jgi:hypothetical protein
MAHVGRGRVSSRLSEIAAHRRGEGVFETCRWILREKGRDVSAVCRSVVGRRLKEKR